MIVLRIVLGIGVVIWLAFWVAVVVGRLEADPVAASIGLLIFAGWLLLRRRGRRAES